MPNKVIFYIDGLNLYNGLKEAHLRKYYWLNLYELAKKLCFEDEKIINVKYFTSIVSSKFDIGKYYRQATYIGVLKTLSRRFKIITGRHQRGKKTCGHCGYTSITFKEKMTDVNIGSQIFEDAHLGKCDIIKLISGDSDLIPICKTVIKLFPDIKLIILFPPKRHTAKMEKYCTSSRVIFPNIIKSCQFPEIVINKKGKNFIKPEYWS
ncbi:MAG: hypothetical protein COT09_00485 [Candidatus Hydromicrobium americanum]|nr:MAG: hypothetical protein COT09_00485 [Candidatus Hydromicrobium americanum]